MPHRQAQTDRSFGSRTRSNRRDVRACVCAAAPTYTHITSVQPNRAITSTCKHYPRLMRVHNRASLAPNERTKTNKHRTIHNHDQIDSKTVRHRLCSYFIFVFISSNSSDGGDGISSLAYTFYIHFAVDVALLLFSSFPRYLF